MTEAAIVDIVDVEPEAVRIPVYAIMPSDKVFDIWGNRYDVLDVRTGRTRRDGTISVWIKRADRPGEWECIGEAAPGEFAASDTITVIPSFGARRAS